jgi:putative CGCGG family rSAM target protein
MPDARPDHDDGTEPVTGEFHEHAWAADLERPEHAADRDLLLAEAAEAIETTAEGTHVQLVTHEAHGAPEEYLYPFLEREFGDGVPWEYVCQCNCGGHIVRVHV